MQNDRNPNYDSLGKGGLRGTSKDDENVLFLDLGDGHMVVYTLKTHQLQT